MNHRISVVTARGGRKFRWKCSCGAAGFEVESEHRAEQQGRDHKAKKTRR